jgi:hypothetical protein
MPISDAITKPVLLATMGAISLTAVAAIATSGGAAPSRDSLCDSSRDVHIHNADQIASEDRAFLNAVVACDGKELTEAQEATLWELCINRADFMRGRAPLIGKIGPLIAVEDDTNDAFYLLMVSMQLRCVRAPDLATLLSPLADGGGASGLVAGALTRALDPLADSSN